MGNHLGLFWFQVGSVMKTDKCGEKIVVNESTPLSNYPPMANLSDQKKNRKEMEVIKDGRNCCIPFM